MNLRRAMCVAASTMAIVVAAPALAQAPQQQSSVWGDSAPQQPAQPATSPWGAPSAAAAPSAPSPWDRPQQAPPCVEEFTKLRDVTEKRAMAIRAASERKADPKEACALFNAFTAAEAKMIKYAVDNQVGCGIPAQIIDGMKKGHVRSADIRTKVCRAASAPARSTAPTLSDSLTAPVPDSNNIKTGRGTFDTLTGSPLGAR